ncbi:MAG: XdhC family protein [Lewinellaceae bacterium]|nr:XdhC family protein [Lewinellaceae bacterium]
MMEIWTFISEKLQSGQGVQLLVVVESRGSSPGRQGFKLALAADGAWTGTVGGGVMEHNLLQQAAGFLREELPAPYLRYQNHRPEATENASGMHCMGNQWVAFVSLGEKEKPLIEAIAEGRAGVLRLGPGGFFFEENRSAPAGPFFYRKADTNWQYEEPLGEPPTLYLFGAGHVGQAVCRQFSLLGFRIALFDDRPELPGFSDNPYAWRKEAVDYGQIGSLVPEGPQVYVIILTAGHESDALVLEQLLEKDLRYLGMLGSKGKAHTIFRRFREKGIPEERLERVYTPIGLPIRSRTPEEIAVSIAAEVIQVKNK